MYYDLDHYAMNYFNQPQPEPDSYIRVLHASPDAPPVDIYVNNNLVASNLAYQGFTPYLSLFTGRYNIKVFAAGTRTNPVINTNVNIPPNSIFTVAAVGKLRDISLLPILEPRMRIPSGRLNVRFAHLSPDAPRVDVRLGDGTMLFSNVAFKEVTNYLLVNPGTYTFQVFLAGTNERVLHVPNITLKANRFYTIYAVGLAAGNPPLQVLIPLDGNSYLR